jgi:hypothetical protein
LSETTSEKRWGKAYKGLRIRIDVNTRADQRHDIVLLFQNAHKKQIQFWQSGFKLNTMVQCYDSKGASAEPTSEGLEWLRSFSPGGLRSSNIPVVLNPGQVYECRPVELERLYQLTPHEEYKVRVVYEEHLGIGWSGAITSNIVKVRM